MEEEKQYQTEWEAGTTEEEEELGEDKSGKLVLKIGAVIILLAFVAFSYAWQPIFWPPNLDFLKQDQTLSEEELVRQCKPAVVNLQVIKTAGPRTIGQGTGFNLEPEGKIVTNRHVVEGASSVEIIFSDGNRFFSRDIELIDGYDLAIIRINGNNLPTIPVVNNRLVEVGQTVTIIGNPMGFQRISARGEVESYFKTKTGMLVFTITALIAPGSSGSPVLDGTGHLVGIVFATGTVTIDGEDHSRALAIPATAMSQIAKDLD